MIEKINWGIMGAGRISRTFVNDLKFLSNANVIAVASKDNQKAKEFSSDFNIKYYYDSYKEMVKNDEIDVIYIGTTHNYHYENMMLCIENNKAVLCEKPFTVNSKEALQVISKAKEKNVFVMEAMWSRYTPAYKKIREIIESGLIGDIKFLYADFGFEAPDDPQHRAFNPTLAGGSLLDVGIYPISFAYWIYKKNPIIIETLANIGKTGVDEDAGIIFKYDDGAMAMLSSSVRVHTQKEAIVIGKKGSIRIHSPFFHSRRMSINIGDTITDYYFDYPGLGYHFEAEHVMQCLREGKKESEILTLNETLEIMKTLDVIRNKWGMKYPFE